MDLDELKRAKSICAAWHSGEIENTPENQMMYANALELVRKDNQRKAKGKSNGPGPFTMENDAKWIRS